MTALDTRSRPAPARGPSNLLLPGLVSVLTVACSDTPVQVNFPPSLGDGTSSGGAMDTTMGAADTIDEADSTSTGMGEESSGPGPTCGNGVIEPDEDCEGDDLDRQSCEALGYDGGALACQSDCLFDLSECYACGDGSIDPGEQCDGEVLAGQDCVSVGLEGGFLDCTADCMLDTTGCFGCGDGAIDTNEQCDGDVLAGQTCASAGFDGGTLACSRQCTLDTSMCFVCGDGAIGGAEECDGAALGGQDCISAGFEGGTLGCAPDCTLDTSMCFSCGNGALEFPEQCDGADLGGQDCVSAGYDGGTLGCTPGCALDPSGCFECGDGAIDPGEECDGADLAGQDCISQNFDDGVLVCSAACTFDTTGCISFECGNGVADGSDECDQGDLAGQDCISQNFDGGVLGCTAGCSFDTSGCFVCGDGVLGGAEECDQDELAGQDCISQNFDGGVLGCTAGCSYDTSGCFVCGDGVVGGAEECDDTDLGNQTCEGLMFDGGVLGCTAGCSYDTSGCFVCGDGVAEGTEECDDTDLGGQTCLDQDPAFTGGVLACDPQCAYDTTGCTSLPLPGPGEVVISELMTQPIALPVAEGQWVELYNPTMQSFQLRECSLVLVAPAAMVTIDVDLVLDPDMHVTLAPLSGLGPGFSADWSWPAGALLLPAVDAELQLVCEGMIVDTVAYDDGTSFPSAPGATLQLDAAHLDPIENDLGSNWCEGTADFFMGDRGTPGAGNSFCGVDFCRLQDPVDLTAMEGSNQVYYGRVYIEGLTDLTPVVDSDPRVIGWVGYGPENTDPATDGGWTWTEAVPNPGWDDVVENDNDEYQVDLVLPPVGIYDTAYRFTADGGATFTYCDADMPGSSNGYSLGQAGMLETTP